MKEYERKQLLERIGRDGATVGASVPETIDLQGEPFELQSFVFETKRQAEVPANHRERVDSVKKRLRAERQERRRQLEHEDIDRARGEELVETIVGIDRALNALESLGETDLTQASKSAETADQKRWLAFLKKALGHDSDDSGPGARVR
ncbi:DUF5788 family protein [Halanaeroarchaeum sp. HSR-CO]|uniref:DUF5788 family protein n=1 Tax=Halanaeroarchaeum sp. HSR-CO TaxID=2866382 RepID=UPI00217CD2F5|nr:DUF5788 family protein [Halanaeroarchaeum sp. HSR-CO]